MARVNSPIPIRRLAAGNDTYARGFHEGDAGGLDTVDTDLATPNIKSGVNVFGKAGSTDVRDSTGADAALSDVKNGKTFYAGGGVRKTGNLATVALAPGSGAYPQGYHAGEGGGLVAVDADLVTGNIKKDVVIFGFTGTYEQTLAEDVEGDGDYDLNRGNNAAEYWKRAVASGISLASVVLTFAAGSLAFAGGYANGWGSGALELYMGGVLMQTSTAFSISYNYNRVVRDVKALSGSQTCEIKNDATLNMLSKEGTSGTLPAAIAVGSVRIV